MFVRMVYADMYGMSKVFIPFWKTHSPDAFYVIFDIDHILWRLALGVIKIVPYAVDQIQNMVIELDGGLWFRFLIIEMVASIVIIVGASLDQSVTRINVKPTRLF